MLTKTDETLKEKYGATNWALMHSIRVMWEQMRAEGYINDCHWKHSCGSRRPQSFADQVEREQADLASAIERNAL